MLLQKAHILFYLLFTSVVVMAQDVSFNAKPSKNRLGVNERLKIEFTVNQDGDNFRAPSFEGFEVVGGPSQSHSRQWVNGKSSVSISFSYILAPKKRGKITINQAEITINGEVYKSPPVTIDVTAAVEIPKDPNDPNYIAKNNIHLVAEVSKANPYLNEALTVVYKLYVSPETSVSNWNVLDNPKYTDFWSQNIDEKQVKIYEGEYQGQPYRYVILRRTVLYPQKTGKLTIEPLSLSISVDVPTNKRDIFGRRIVRPANIPVAAKIRTIDVKPLPLDGRPDDFSGAVGNLDFEVTTDKTVLDATEAFQLKVIASGNGNLKLFDLPKPTLPGSLEVYEPEHEENVRTNLSGMSGQISDTYTVVPQYKGKYPIPRISFSYFDPIARNYKRITADDIVVEVKSGPIDNSETTTTSNTGTARQSVVANGDQFRYIKSVASFQSIAKQTFFKTKAFWLYLLCPLFLIPIAIIVRKKRQSYSNDVQGNRIRKANKLARKFLGEAKKNLGDQKAFYIAMERALHNYLKAKLQIQTSDMSKDRINRLLQERGTESSSTIEFIGLLESCEFARYTPTSSVTMQQDYDKAVRVISALDKQL